MTLQNAIAERMGMMRYQHRQFIGAVSSKGFWTKRRVITLLVLIGILLLFTWVFNLSAAPRTQQPPTDHIHPPTDPQIERGVIDRLMIWLHVKLNSFRRGKGYSTYKHGVQALESKHYQEAIELYREALAQGIQVEYQWRSYADLGVCYRSLKQYDKAIEAFQDALRLNPNFVEGHHDLALLYRLRGQIDDAIASLKTALRINPAFADSHNSLGNLYADQERFDEAIAELQTAIQLNPNWAEAHTNLGKVYVAQGRLDEAIEAHQQAIRLKSRPEFHYHLGLAHERRGDAADAITHYQACIGLILSNNSHYLERRIPQVEAKIQKLKAGIGNAGND